MTTAIKKIFNMHNVVLGVLLVALIMVGEVVLEKFHLATWPAFMIMVFFFMAHAKIKEAPAILIGCFFGFCNLIIIKYWYGLTVPIFGGNMAKATSPETVEAMFNSKLVYVAIFVLSIIFLKDVITWVFNDYAFMVFIFAALASGGNSAAALVGKTVAGAANAVAAKGDPAAIAAMKAATDKALATTIPITNVYQWMGIELIGGGLFIVGIFLIGKVLAKLPGAHAAAHGHDIKG
ncbi:hypothetical protein [Desulfosporosinus metallidurans]|uniref:Uncharacterized protein n=1 Tax=Desulfosporosinus metallidurans TaxID=1888891 RepID=A0A1Q8QS51_9FIRM|nr:hypothetical protein [Desulfosporosinus metallidurans]OLN30185.1 hypothetical protein DSOL_3128 [Desulfosporosinus metallidurans]